MDETTQNTLTEDTKFAVGENGVKSTDRLVVESIILAAVTIVGIRLVRNAVDARRFRKMKQAEK